MNRPAFSFVKILSSKYRRAALAGRVIALLSCSWAASSSLAATANFATPAMDKWMYQNSVSFTDYGGARTEAPIFATLNSSDEDRLGTMLVAFNTSPLITAGLGAQAYAVTSVKLRVSVLLGDSFFYDPTHDTYQTYLPADNASHQADSDTGRPVEVFGVALRNGFTGLSGSVNAGANPYTESSPFLTSGAPNPRNAYPLGVGAGGALFDVADNIGQELEAVPFGVGTAAGLTPGQSVPAGTELTFELQLSGAILASIQASLNSGVLGLYLSSLDIAESQNGAVTYPTLITREGAAALGAEYAPHLDITYSIVPEPGPVLSILLGIGVLSAGRAFFHRRTFL
jgi:hypothetical protein